MAINKKLQLVLRAMEFAAIAHRDQRRKDDFQAPYINHPIQLARLLSEHGISDEITLSAAILHDVIEDTGTTLDALRAMFGDDIAGVVAEVSDDKTLPKDVRKQLQIEHAAVCSKRAKLVKLADKICNVRDLLIAAPAGWSQQRMSEYVLWAMKVVDNLRGTNSKLEAVFDKLLIRAVERGMIIKS
jgi:guanosine-3',5'-bis(diphosphate) 3'-pyrophosphohydrolase